MTREGSRGQPREASAWPLTGFGDEIDADPRVQVAVLKALGASHIEVRSAWEANVVDMTSAQLGELAAVLHGEAMAVSAVASPIGKVDVTLPLDHELERLRRVVDAARTLGTIRIRVFSFYHHGKPPDSVRGEVVERMRALADLASQEGITLLHENEKGIYGDTPERIAAMVDEVDSPALKLVMDFANFVQVGVRPFSDAYELLHHHVDYLHVKDACALDGFETLPGQGDGEIEAALGAFKASGYNGFVSLEPHLLASHQLSGFSGPTAFGEAARALRHIAERVGVTLV